MFSIVNKKEDHVIFEQLWGDFCEERQLAFVDRGVKPVRYLLRGEGEKCIGTIEFASYRKGQSSNAEYFYPFSENQYIQELSGLHVYETGKLSIKKQYRGRGHFKHLALIVLIHALENKADWYIAVVTKRMFLYLRSLGFSIQPVDEDIPVQERLTLIPVRIDVKQGISQMLMLKEFRDVIKVSLHAQMLLKENYKNIMST
ncbi:hypothetical protein [Bacillus sp. 165]|uniref:hypothetical protein n=1 Tax=Bacillus sp. 165 TaxID=1529117 RepID=UPI001ADC6B02|nr:hypothetical protein [Bacillus sp. 165]MBO9129320.1 hypothetical protein [Bacillus sp. 165]